MINLAKKKKEIEEKEPLTDIIDEETLEILDKTVEKLDKEIFEKNQSDILVEHSTETRQSKEFRDDMKETKFYLDFFINIAMMIINPILKKNEIKEITLEEMKDLTTALIGIASEKMLSTSGKIGKSISKIVNLPQIMKLVTILWQIIFPRLSKYLETHKKTVPETTPEDYGL